MPSIVQQEARRILRESGPMDLGELARRILEDHPLSSKNPKLTIRNALRDDPTIQSTGDNRFVYLPSFVTGAAVFLPMDFASAKKGLLAMGAEVSALLWPGVLLERPDRERVLELQNGPRIPAGRNGYALSGEMHQLIQLPTPFWSWWEEWLQEGAEGLVLRCVDGEGGRYVVQPARRDERALALVAQRNEQVQNEAATVLNSARNGMTPLDLSYRLIARGVYHAEPTPDSLADILLAPGKLFYQDGFTLEHRYDLSPALRQLLDIRFRFNRLYGEQLLRSRLGLPPSTVQELEYEPPPEKSAEILYRVKVTLQWMPDVWRIIEILDNQTLEDLHYAIQHAFGWDDDHLYAFFLTGRPWDDLTEVQRPWEESDGMPPLADEVVLSAMELKPGFEFLYIFDFGDDLRHDIKVVDALPARTRGNFPRIAERHGKAPPQYPSFD